MSEATNTDEPCMIHTVCKRVLGIEPGYSLPLRPLRTPITNTICERIRLDYMTCLYSRTETAERNGVSPWTVTRTVRGFAGGFKKRKVSEVTIAEIKRRWAAGESRKDIAQAVQRSESLVWNHTKDQA